MSLITGLLINNMHNKFILKNQNIERKKKFFSTLAASLQTYKSISHMTTHSMKLKNSCFIINEAQYISLTFRNITKNRIKEQYRISTHQPVHLRIRRVS